MKKTVIALALAALSLPALAQQKPPAPDYTISGNFGLTSDYRFRGISQSNKKPAVQGGIDFEHKSGLYLGNWNSSVSEWTTPQGAGIEMDLYGGFKTEVFGLDLDVGAIYYYYPNAQYLNASGLVPGDTTNVNNTRELYIGVGYGPFSLKTSYTLSKYYFAIGRGADESLLNANPPSAKGTLYYDFGFSHEIAPKLTLSAHAGILDIKGKTGSNIKDYSVGVAYDLEGWELGLTVYSTSGLNDADKTFFTSTDGRLKKLYGSGAAISLTKSF